MTDNNEVKNKVVDIIDQWDNYNEDEPDPVTDDDEDDTNYGFPPATHAERKQFMTYLSKLNDKSIRMVITPWLAIGLSACLTWPDLLTGHKTYLVLNEMGLSLNSHESLNEQANILRSIELVELILAKSTSLQQE